jgi:hypothetical protein
MPALDLGPGNRLPALAASSLDRASVRELFQEGLYGASKQRRLRLMGAPRLAGERRVNLRREL